MLRIVLRGQAARARGDLHHPPGHPRDGRRRPLRRADPRRHGRQFPQGREDPRGDHRPDGRRRGHGRPRQPRSRATWRPTRAIRRPSAPPPERGRACPVHGRPAPVPSSRIGAGSRTPSTRCPAAARSQVMKIALDPFMHRHLSLEELPSKVAELGYEWIELSPRARLPRMVQGAARLPRPDQGLQEGAAGRQRRHRLAAADVPLGLERRGRAAGGGASLEARHRDRRRTRRRHDELRVRPRPAPRQGVLLLLPHRLDDRGLRGRLVALDGGAGADLREGGHQPPRRAASRGLVRDAPAGASTSSARSTRSA